MKCRADGKRRQWTAVRRGAVDQGSSAGLGHGGTGSGLL